jgi:hypothetical protein
MQPILSGTYSLANKYGNIAEWAVRSYFLDQA